MVMGLQTRMMHPVDSNYTQDITLFASAVEVVPLWDASVGEWYNQLLNLINYSNIVDETGPPCSFAPDMADSDPAYPYLSTYSLFQYATFHCPARVLIPKGKLLLLVVNI